MFIFKQISLDAIFSFIKHVFDKQDPAQDAHDPGFSEQQSECEVHLAALQNGGVQVGFYPGCHKVL